MKSKPKKRLTKKQRDIRRRWIEKVLCLFVGFCIAFGVFAIFFTPDHQSRWIKGEIAIKEYYMEKEYLEQYQESEPVIVSTSSNYPWRNYARGSYEWGYNKALAIIQIVDPYSYLTEFRTSGTDYVLNLDGTINTMRKLLDKIIFGMECPKWEFTFVNPDKGLTYIIKIYLDGRCDIMSMVGIYCMEGMRDYTNDDIMKILNKAKTQLGHDRYKVYGYSIYNADSRYISVHMYDNNRMPLGSILLESMDVELLLHAKD